MLPVSGNTTIECSQRCRCSTECHHTLKHAFFFFLSRINYACPLGLCTCCHAHWVFLDIYWPALMGLNWLSLILCSVQGRRCPFTLTFPKTHNSICYTNLPRKCRYRLEMVLGKNGFLGAIKGYKWKGSSLHTVVFWLSDFVVLKCKYFHKHVAHY